MQALMQDGWPLVVTKVRIVSDHDQLRPQVPPPNPDLPPRFMLLQIIDHAAKFHGDQEVVSRSVEGPTEVSTYAQVRQRAALCCLALRRLGVRSVYTRDGDGLA
jgi:hypothetical protein